MVETIWQQREKKRENGCVTATNLGLILDDSDKERGGARPKVLI